MAIKINTKGIEKAHGKNKDQIDAILRAHLKWTNEIRRNAGKEFGGGKMKIKTTKQMRLDELIKHVREDDIRNKGFIANSGRSSVYFDSDQKLSFVDDAYGEMEINRTFAVEVEEEMTEDTEVHGATLVYYSELNREIKTFRYADESSPTLKHITRQRSGTVALAVFSGKQLVWSEEHGIPTDGVLEVTE